MPKNQHSNEQPTLGPAHVGQVDHASQGSDDAHHMPEPAQHTGTATHSEHSIGDMEHAGHGHDMGHEGLESRAMHGMAEGSTTEMHMGHGMDEDEPANLEALQLIARARGYSTTINS